MAWPKASFSSSSSSFAGVTRQPGNCGGSDGNDLKILIAGCQFDAGAVQAKEYHGQAQSRRTTHPRNRSYRTITTPRGHDCSKLDLNEIYIHTPLDWSGRRIHDKKNAEPKVFALVREPMAQDAGEWGDIGCAEEVKALKTIRNQNMRADTVGGMFVSTIDPKIQVVDSNHPKSRGKESHLEKPGIQRQQERRVCPGNTQEPSGLSYLHSWQQVRHEAGRQALNRPYEQWQNISQQHEQQNQAHCSRTSMPSALEPHRKWDDETDSVGSEIVSRMDDLSVNDEVSSDGDSSSRLNAPGSLDNSEGGLEEDSEDLISF